MKEDNRIRSCPSESATIADTNEDSGNQGDIWVLAFDERKEAFDVIGRYDYFENLYQE